jgi:RimJ/RimL family protein N-acetyltransferase
MKPILETARLALREMTTDDLDFVAAMLAHPEVMRFYPQLYSRDEAKQWIERQLGRYARNGHLIVGTAAKPPGNEREKPFKVGQVSLQDLVDDVVADDGGLVGGEIAESRGFSESVD